MVALPYNDFADYSLVYGCFLRIGFVHTVHIYFFRVYQGRTAHSHILQIKCVMPKNPLFRSNWNVYWAKVFLYIIVIENNILSFNIERLTRFEPLCQLRRIQAVRKCATIKRFVAPLCVCVWIAFDIYVYCWYIHINIGHILIHTLSLYLFDGAVAKRFTFYLYCQPFHSNNPINSTANIIYYYHRCYGMFVFILRSNYLAYYYVDLK